MEQVVTFPSGQVRYLFESAFSKIWEMFGPDEVIFITDSNVAEAHPALFEGKQTIVLPFGEYSKSLSKIEDIVMKLMDMEATRSSVLIGVGGGVVTDITGFVAAIYMRGVQFGFVPTTVLGMVDAAIGGKNGVNINTFYKNIAGTVTQPHFILYDTQLLQTLPLSEWSNGFAEIIKYACLFDAPLFEELSQRDLNYYRHNQQAMQQLITRCADWKNKVVVADEHEKGERKLLNFGHTAAHAIENFYELPHGQAVALGMIIAATLSESHVGLSLEVTKRLREILVQYGLPIKLAIDVKQTMETLKKDKKRKGDTVDYILLEAIGKGVIHPLTFDVVEKAISKCAQ